MPKNWEPQQSLRYSDPADSEIRGACCPVLGSDTWVCDSLRHPAGALTIPKSFSRIFVRRLSRDQPQRGPLSSALEPAWAAVTLVYLDTQAATSGSWPIPFGRYVRRSLTKLRLCAALFLTDARW